MTTMRDEGMPHGTAVASMAVGKTVGVAKSAKFIGVKFRSDKTANPADLTECWSWIVDDVIAKNRVGKAIINMSYGEYSVIPKYSLAHSIKRGFSRLALLGLD